MKINFLLLMALLFIAPKVLFANHQIEHDDEYVIVDGERRLLARLEFVEGEINLNDESAATLAELAPFFADGEMRRYEIHGHFCVGVDGSRRIAVFRAESMVQYLIGRGVSEGRILSLVNPSTQRVTVNCAHDRRIDIMTVDLRRVRKSEIVEEPEPIVAAQQTAPIMSDISVDESNVTPEQNVSGQNITSGQNVETRHALSLQTSPRTVAVYMAGNEPTAVRGVHNILGGELTRVISSHQNFIAVDRTDFILAALEDEHDYQRSGMVDDEQIKDLGRQLGVEFMCISNIIAVGNGYYIDTRLVDVVTAEVVRSITATSSLRDGAEKMRVARDIANELVDPDRANRCGVGDDTRYDPAHQFCFGGRAYNLCGGSGFNPQTQGCLPNQTIGTRCADGTIVSLGTHCGNHTLSVAVAPVNGGSIIRAPDLQTYGADQTVALSAVANRGFTFAGWAGTQSSSDQSINITMTRNMPVIAMFRPENNNALITTAFPNGGGTISRSPESDVYQSGEVVSVTATPARGFEFVGWEGATSETSPTINIMIDEGKTLVAIFRPNLHTLNAVAMPEFGGSVFINGTALAAATTSEFGNIVEVFAQPAQGYIFTGWSGGTSGNTNPTTIDLTNSNVNVIANFAPDQQRIEDENVSRIISVETRHALSLQTQTQPEISTTTDMSTNVTDSKLWMSSIPAGRQVFQIGGPVASSYSGVINPAFINEENYLSFRFLFSTNTLTKFYHHEAGVTYPINHNSAIGFSWLMQSAEAYDERDADGLPTGRMIQDVANRFALSYANNVWERLTVGGNFSFLFNNVPVDETQTGMSLDVGLSYKILQHQSFGNHLLGISTNNLINSFFDDTEEAYISALRFSLRSDFWDSRIYLGADFVLQDVFSSDDDWNFSQRVGLNFSRYVKLYGLTGFNPDGFDHYGFALGINMSKYFNGRDIEALMQYISVAESEATQLSFSARAEFGKHRNERRRR